MIKQSVSLASNGVVKVPSYEQLVRFGYTKNRGVYRLHVDATGEWEGLTIRAFFHVPDGKDPPSSLVTGGSVDVPASVTAQPGNGCITFEGSDGTKTVTSADLRYRVSANSGTEDGTEPEPGSPAWQQLVDSVHTDATTAEQAKNDAQTAASEAATSAGNANQSAQEAADSLQELKDGIASGNFKGDKGDKGEQGIPGPAGADGEPGRDGVDGKDGAPGKDGTSATHSWNGTVLTITSASGTSSADLKGDKGDKGDKGEPGPAGSIDNLTAESIKSALGYTPADSADLADKLPKSPTDWEPWTADEKAAAHQKIGLINYELALDYTTTEDDENSDSVYIHFEKNDYTKIYVIFDESGIAGTTYSSVRFGVLDQTRLHAKRILANTNPAFQVNRKWKTFKGEVIKGFGFIYQATSELQLYGYCSTPSVGQIQSENISGIGGITWYGKIYAGTKIRVWGFR